jgi:hypothetical protein
MRRFEKPDILVQIQSQRPRKNQENTKDIPFQECPARGKKELWLKKKHYVSVVQWLGQRPFTAWTRVRIPSEMPEGPHKRAHSGR